MKSERKRPERMALHFLLGYEWELCIEHVTVKQNNNNNIHPFFNFSHKVLFLKSIRERSRRFFFRKITPSRIIRIITYTCVSLLTLVKVIGDTSSRKCINRSARTFDNVDNITHQFDKGRFIIYICTYI